MADLLSVGIDIGTTTTQLIFSKIKMENTTGYFAVPRISIVDKEILYQSEVHLTPLLTETLIDSDGVREIVAQEYQKAGIVPSSVDTGAVIITGESARKENARAVMERLSAFAGEFVVSTAGPDLESVIAGKGSGAWAYSLDHHCEAVNLDIGGGTTNIVVFSEGDVIAKGCFDIGGRLIRVENGRITHISPSAKLVAESLGSFQKSPIAWQSFWQSLWASCRRARFWTRLRPITVRRSPTPQSQRPQSSTPAAWLTALSH